MHPHVHDVAAVEEVKAGSRFQCHVAAPAVPPKLADVGGGASRASWTAAHGGVAAAAAALPLRGGVQGTIEVTPPAILHEEDA